MSHYCTPRNTCTRKRGASLEVHEALPFFSFRPIPVLRPHTLQHLGYTDMGVESYTTKPIRLTSVSSKSINLKMSVSILRV